jgi:threonine dehydrogenase-like Zn-dependent dehydrogenase
MQALIFRYSLPRLAATRILSSISPAGFFGPWSPMTLTKLPDPQLPGDDWLIVRTVNCGICGSDAKQAFLKGDRDNPVTALISFPHVLGHEIVGVVERVGPAVRERRQGDRVVINPWLSCAPRGIEPPCAACQAGDYPLCEHFTEGRIAPGIHIGNCADVAGGFAELVAAHESEALPIPEGMSWDTAALADPFSVSLHAVLRHPPSPSSGEPALVFGCGTLGLLTVAVLRMLHPMVPVFAIARYPHQAELAKRFGAHQVLMEGADAAVERIAELTGAKILRPWSGKPWLWRGAGIVYDTVGSPGSVEQSLRVASPRAKIVVSGVEAPRRFEWTPLYMKEIDIVGSNAFGVETFEGRRMHAMQAYFELVARGLDVTPIISHRFPLRDYRKAFLALRNKGKTGAVKALFTFGDVAAS